MKIPNLRSSHSVTSTFAVCLTGFLMVAISVSPSPAADETEIEASIVKGLAFLADPAQRNDEGVWGGTYDTMDTCNRVAVTALVVLKFETRAQEIGFVDPMNPGYEYHQEVIDGLNYIVSHKQDVDISGEPDADGDGDNIGTYFNDCPGYHDVYTTGAAMMALAASQRPDLYGALLQDAVDWMTFAQNNTTCGVHRGGWGYGANDCTWSENSNGGYATLGLGFAAASPPHGFAMTIKPFVISELSLWVDALQDPQGPPGDVDDGGSHYNPGGGWVNILKTGNLIYEMHMAGDSIGATRLQHAIEYIERNWNATGGGGPGWMNHTQAAFTMMKGFESYGIDLIDTDGDTFRDDKWFDQVSTHLIANQDPVTGGWPWDPWGGEVLATTWALLTLEKVVPETPIPAVSTWGLLVIALLLLAGSKVYFGRRHPARL